MEAYNAVPLSARLAEIMRVVFERPELVPDAETSLGATPGWDSLSHIDLISRIEQTFKITLSMKEILETQTFEKLLKILSARTGLPAV